MHVLLLLSPRIQRTLRLQAPVEDGRKLRERLRTSWKRQINKLFSSDWYTEFWISNQLQEANDALTELSNNPDTPPPSQSMSRAVQRHCEVYQDYGREFHRTKVCSCCTFSCSNFLLV